MPSSFHKDKQAKFHLNAILENGGGLESGEICQIITGIVDQFE
jgi:hypothetical protein